MNVVQLSNYLASKDIKLSLSENNSLKISYDGDIDPEDVELIRNAKGEFLSYFKHKSSILPLLFPLKKDGFSAEVLNAIPLGLNQNKLWLVKKTISYQSDAAYNINLSINLNYSIEVELFRRSINQLLARHEILGSTIFEREGVPLINWAKYKDLDVSVINQASQDLNKIKSDFFSTPFDFDDSPLFRVMLLTGSDNKILISLHHIISDGWSVNVMISDLLALYETFKDNNSFNYPVSPINYCHYIFWQKELFDKGMFDYQMQFWIEAMRDAPAALSLPMKAVRPAVFSHRGAVNFLQLSKLQSDRLKLLSTGCAVTIPALLMSVYYIVLWRYTNQQDLVVGVPVAGRNHPELDNVIGFFTNTLPIRVVIDDELSFTSFVNYVNHTWFEALEHQDVPFDLIIDALKLDRNPSFNPLFQVMFVFQNSMGGGQVNSEWRSDSSFLEAAAFAKFDLTMELSDRESGIFGKIEYASDLYSEDFIEEFIKSFNYLLSQIIECPDKILKDYFYLPEERRAFIGALGVGSKSDDFKFFHELFESEAQRNPDVTALLFEGKKLTYSELNSQADILAINLQNNLNVSSNVIIGILLPRSFEMVISLLAILKAGGAYLPLDPEFPAERLDYILEDSGVHAAITNRELSHLLSKPIGLCFEDLILQRSINVLTKISKSYLDTSLAYIIYTSGSTGRPKGVMIEHRNISNYARFALNTYLSGINGGVVSSTICFDATFTSLFVPLIAGLTVSLIKENNFLDELIVLLKTSCDPMLFKLSPAHIELIVAAGHFDVISYMPHRFVIGGDQLSMSLAEKLLTCFPNSEFVNEYGPTETVVGCCYFVFDKQLKFFNRAAVPIGNAIDNTNLYVLSKDLKFCPLGVVGELYIGGAGVGRGYLNNKKLTDERFVSIQLSGSKKERLYATGDYVRWIENSLLEYVGRVDEQIKINGVRIELAEIESALLKCEGVAQSAVIKNDNNQLIAFLVLLPNVIPSKNNSVMVDRIRIHINRALPIHMLPASYVILDAFPLNANGKIDKKYLSEIKVCSNNNLSYIAPVSDLETSICSLFGAVFSSENIGLNDNFYALGGNSLTALKIAFSAKALGIDLMPMDIMHSVTIAETVERYKNRNDSIKIELKESNSPGVEFTVPLLPSQHAFFHMNLKNLSHWNAAAIFENSSNFSIKSIVGALRLLSRRHECLRVRFLNVGDSWRQFIVPTLKKIPFFVHDITGSPESHSLKIQNIAKSYQESFDILSGPLWAYILLYDRKINKTYTLVISHHLLTDAYSTQKLFDEFYAAVSGTLPDHVTMESYIDVAGNFSKFAKTYSFNEEFSYWQRTLSGARGILNGDDGQSQSTEAMVRFSGEFFFEKEITDVLLLKIPKIFKIQRSAVILSMLFIGFKKYIGNQRVMVDLGQRGREFDFEGLRQIDSVGWFASTFPFVLNMSEIDDKLAALQYANTSLVEALGYGANYSLLRYVVEDSEVKAFFSEAPTPKMSVSITIDENLNAPAKNINKRLNLDISPYIAPVNEVKYLIEFWFRVYEGKLGLNVKYAGDLYSQETITTLIQEIIRIGSSYADQFFTHALDA